MLTAGIIALLFALLATILVLRARAGGAERSKAEESPVLEAWVRHALVQELAVRGFPLIDCQMKTPLLASLGAREIPRAAFLRALTALVNYAEPPGKWSLVQT